MYNLSRYLSFLFSCWKRLPRVASKHFYVTLRMIFRPQMNNSDLPDLHKTSEHRSQMRSFLKRYVLSNEILMGASCFENMYFIIIACFRFVRLWKWLTVEKATLRWHCTTVIMILSKPLAMSWTERKQLVWVVVYYDVPVHTMKSGVVCLVHHIYTKTNSTLPKSRSQ